MPVDPSGRQVDDSGASSSSNGASSKGNSFAEEYDAEIGSLPALPWSVDHVSGEEMLLAKLSRRLSGKSSSAALPSHFIQSSHSSISISALKALSKMLFSGLTRPLGVINSTSPFAALRYKFLETMVVRCEDASAQDPGEILFQGSGVCSLAIDMGKQGVLAS